MLNSVIRFRGWTLKSETNVNNSSSPENPGEFRRIPENNATPSQGRKSDKKQFNFFTMVNCSMFVQKFSEFCLKSEEKLAKLSVRLVGIFRLKIIFSRVIAATLKCSYALS